MTGASEPEPWHNFLAAKTESVLAHLRSGALSWVRAGQDIAEVKAELPHGAFKQWVNEALPISYRTATKLKQIGTDPNILRCIDGDPKVPHAAPLPGDRAILYELCGLPEDEFDGFVRDGVIHADMRRGDVRRARVAKDHALPGKPFPPLPAGRYGAILADPPWCFRTWGKLGGARSPESHYPTMAMDELKALPVAQLAAKDCALFLWVLSGILPDALDLIKAWGFEYRTSAFVWVKGKMGLGYWTRKGSEQCLLATKGNPRRLNQDVREIIQAPPTRHSEKPVEQYERIERLVGGPHLELFARTARPGWHSWGNDPDLPSPIRVVKDGDANTGRCSASA